MTMPFTDDMDPGEIDRIAAEWRERAESRALAQLGLDTDTVEMKEASALVESLSKRANKIIGELRTARQRERELRTRRDAKIRQALAAKVSPTRLHEVTGVHMSTISNLAKPVADDSVAQDTRSGA